MHASVSCVSSSSAFRSSRLSSETGHFRSVQSSIGEWSTVMFRHRSHTPCADLYGITHRAIRRRDAFMTVLIESMRNPCADEGSHRRMSHGCYCSSSCTLNARLLPSCSPCRHPRSKDRARALVPRAALTSWRALVKKPTSEMDIGFGLSPTLSFSESYGRDNRRQDYPRVKWRPFGPFGSEIRACMAVARMEHRVGL